MNLDKLSLKTTSLLRKAGLSDVPPPVLACMCIVGVILICLAAWHFWPRPSDSFAVATSASVQASSITTREGEESPDMGSSTIIVDIEGAVANPGLYELDADSRVGDAVKAAGGLADNALPGAINLAQRLSDADQVLIPAQGEQQDKPESSQTRTGSSDNGKVNVNTASAEELQKLTGIGPSLSERIIDYREANGRFSSIEELQEVSGIGKTRYENIKDKICI